MNLRRRLHWVWAAVAMTAIGCTSITSQQRAQTLGRGKFEFSLEPGVLAGTPLSSPTFIAAPRADLAGHFGISDRVDLGFRLGSVGLEFMTKFQLTRRDSPVVHVSLAPSVNGVLLFLGGSGGASGGGLLGFQLPLLIGIDTGGGSEFVIGPRAVDQLVFSTGSGSGAANVLLLGGSLGYSIHITDHFRLFPEVSVVAPVLGTVSSGGAVSTGGFTFGGLIIQAVLGFQFGN